MIFFQVDPWNTGQGLPVDSHLVEDDGLHDLLPHHSLGPHAVLYLQGGPHACTLCFPDPDFGLRHVGQAHHPHL